MIDIIATEEHFWDHLRPIRDELVSRGIGVKVTHDKNAVHNFSERYAIVCSYGDLRRAAGSGRQVIFLEHGAGQSYSTIHTSYAGSHARPQVVAFLSPGPHVTKLNQRFWSAKPHYEIGVPKLDPWHKEPTVPPDPKCVCISFHWDCQVCPETRSAFDYYKDHLKELVDAEFRLIGHCHPRARKKIEPVYHELGIEFFPRFDDVLNVAHLYVCDNSSTIYEFASLGRPVLLMNAPWYRRHVHHGLRFWDCADIGEQVDKPEDLRVKILKSLEDPPSMQRAREACVKRVYSHTDGRAAKRAADAIQEVIMAKETAEPGIRLRALRTTSGQYGRLRAGDELVIYPKKMVANGRVHKHWQDPERYASQLCENQGSFTMFARVDAPATPEAPVTTAKKAPVSENKLAPPPQEDKSVTQEPKAASAPEGKPLAELILDLVRAGHTKTEVAEELRKSDQYTGKEVRDLFDDLIEAGKILKEGPDNRPTYTVA